MEVIGSRIDAAEVGATEGALDTEVKECGCRFKLDFRTVYWNSRLGYEHRRVSELIRYGRAMGPNVSTSSSEGGCSSSNSDPIVVADIMSGIGPFTVPLAKYEGVFVHANDLNPSSHRWLKENVKLNGVEGSVKTYNMDGRDFVR